MAKITIPEVLARVAKTSSRSFAVSGGSVAEAIANLCHLHPVLRQHLFHANDSIKDHFLLVVDGRVATPDTALGQDDGLEVMLGTSGGIDCPATNQLSARERDRYARHIALPQIGEQGQRRLRSSRVLVVGTGGLGSPISMYLAAAGVGVLGLADFDTVDESNLQRQIIHGVDSIGMRKVHSADRRLRNINDDLIIETYDFALDAANACEIVGNYDVVVDGCDNYETRYVLNDACFENGKPYVYGSISQFDGQASVFSPGEGPCYRCLFPSRPPAPVAPNEQAKGVLGVLPGVIGAIQATEALKLLLHVGDPLIGRLLVYDALGMAFREVAFESRVGCPLCSERQSAQRRRRYA